MSNSGGKAAIVGGGPAGLMAAELLASSGVHVEIFERMPSPARKFLLAGRGGLNLTHSEPLPAFLERYGPAASRFSPAIEAFTPADLRAWSEGLGMPTFTGSSGRVFPESFKASPLLRAWLGRLGALGVELHARYCFQGWDEDGRLLFTGPSGERLSREADATLLAMGGASWPRLGSTGGWAGRLASRGVAIAPLRPANCGFETRWSAHFIERFAGQPVKPAALSFAGQRVRGEPVVTAQGIEGGAVYALAALLREAIAARGEAVLELDLRPELEAAELARRLAKAPARHSMASRLRKAAGLSPVAAGLLRELAGPELPGEPEDLAARIKALPLRLHATRPIERAISTAGGIVLDELDERFMLRRLPGTFAAGEMLDWEAPTGGYLLQACFSTGAAAARGMLAWLAEQPRD
ncbi:BaiN/RdsA family NAD(P)/FAD-dependent oxidoreductase [Marinimicrococcus flavescens]|uniref:TIGR03862 family flavoprotein n=1 Tax=Marinimicrococcus flavescens TaxID=3031815 RepID=A0AAP3XQ81_9PROT|nr:TIGR03862 family flavoprotein [Marinimicrococcus flavescens]